MLLNFWKIQSLGPKFSRNLCVKYWRNFRYRNTKYVTFYYIKKIGTIWWVMSIYLVLYCVEQMGSEMLEELHHQRHTINHARDKVNITIPPPPNPHLLLHSVRHPIWIMFHGPGRPSLHLTYCSKIDGT